MTYSLRAILFWLSHPYKPDYQYELFTADLTIDDPLSPLRRQPDNAPPLPSSQRRAARASDTTVEFFRVCGEPASTHSRRAPARQFCIRPSSIKARLPTVLFIACRAMMILAILSIKSHITRSITDRRFDYRRSSVTNPRQPTNTCRRRSGRHVRIRHDSRIFRGGLRTGIDAQPTGTSETILHSAFLHKSQITNGVIYSMSGDYCFGDNIH